MEIVVLNSAYKHGISRQSIYSCLFNFRSDLVLAIPPPKRLFVGFDHLGKALEIIAVEDIEMRLRKQFYYLLEGSNYEL
jgi:hypothetical protein